MLESPPSRTRGAVSNVDGLNLQACFSFASLNGQGCIARRLDFRELDVTADVGKERSSSTCKVDLGRMNGSINAQDVKSSL